ncbi:hypothetical protein HPP92_004654 [Vanilla planifolia]|uniref:NAC domain-containing protein n=1 Tax=Vanilla planifolia TaxID=51239 RepID=A0A835RFJ8_VANPL|nr:hypothetical protein HPP92_004654 [Vanilla planifolia]
MPGFPSIPLRKNSSSSTLRRKGKAKNFLVDLIPFLDLYCFDPWELPAIAIGEKEWFFYVPRDRKQERRSA